MPWRVAGFGLLGWDRWDRGRVFSCSIGHTIADLEVPQVTEIMRRGMIWAARSDAA